MTHRSGREPAKSPLFWIIWLLLILFSVPWYFPLNAYEPIVAGLPLWVLAVIVVSMLYAVFITVSAHKLWR